MKKFIAAAVVAVLEIPAVPAFADPPPWAPAHGKRAKDLVFMMVPDAIMNLGGSRT
ncbi:hypothetical protein [Sphingopyxis sp. MSC1_008]|uniref:hypothetical protein n=1 Tax=Sphingopyxis sp. MSC1_008 TaxID=2909265 RepID=UPI0020BF697D|nr:hypothetical protein [Sphingopyxis sp. MSC1_008]